MTENLSYMYAFGSTFTFAISCIYFTIYANKISSIWMNTFKATIAFVCFVATTFLVFEWNTVTSKSLISFFFSGFLGLGIGDLFLMYAFTRIGAARTLMVFGFGPLFIGLQAYVLFGQTISSDKFLAIFCLITCLLIFSYEGYKKNGSWEIKGVIFALIGVSLDAIGIGITRFGFEDSVAVLPIEANVYRSSGALCFFIIYNYFQPIELLTNFKKLITKDRYIVIIASILGTYLALWFWNSAIRIGHLATISAIGVTGPFLATFYECIYYKKWPNRYMGLASIFFILGLYILLT